MRRLFTSFGIAMLLSTEAFHLHAQDALPTPTPLPSVAVPPTQITQTAPAAQPVSVIPVHVQAVPTTPAVPVPVTVSPTVPSPLVESQLTVPTAPVDLAAPAAGSAAAVLLSPTTETPEQQLLTLQKKVDSLKVELVTAQVAAAQDDKLKGQVELLQKQIELQQKMIQLLMDNAKKQPQLGGTAFEKLQSQVATLEVRAKQAAQRDQELAQHIDTIVEHQDSVERLGPQLPAGVKELFLPSGNNETPLSIYGTLAFGYSNFYGNSSTAANGAGRPVVNGGFYFGEFTPDFFIKVNDWILLESEIGISGNGSVSAGSFAQADFFLNDALTISAGRMVAPLGFYNMRLNNPWINKLPGDAPGAGPLLWQQVLPPFAMLGAQASGAFYVANSPFKFEYNAFVTNGLNLTPATAGAPTLNELANLQNMSNTFSTVSGNMAGGGRVGFWWPERGWNTGFSIMYNPDYIAGTNNSLTAYAVDLSYHKGNWDFRAEAGWMNQAAKPFLNDDIRRQGVSGQIAYRAKDSAEKYLQNIEFVYRYSYVNFTGIDPTLLDLTTFGTPTDVPVRRQQNEVGINYYFAPRMVLKCALQINDEPQFHLHDNQFLMEFAWGF